MCQNIGVFSPYFSKVVGIDISESQIYEAKQKYAANSNIEFKYIQIHHSYTSYNSVQRTEKSQNVKNFLHIELVRAKSCLLKTVALTYWFAVRLFTG